MTAPPFCDGERGLFICEVAILRVNVEFTVEAEIVEHLFIRKTLQEPKVEHFGKIVP